MPLLFPSASSHPSPEEVWTTAFNKLSQRVRPYFVRQESHLRALAYVQALLSSVERKNGWQVAEEVGEVTPYAMQHLLDRARWDCDGVRDELRIYIWETHAAPNAVLVIDEMGFLKKGRKVESQRPELLPLDLQAELHLRSDRTAIAYRKWLRQLGLTFGTA